MKRKKRKVMLGVCGTLFMLAVLSSKINMKACLFTAAVFWVIAVFLLRGKLLKERPVIRDFIIIGMIFLYSAPLYMIMGLGDDLAGLLRAIADDIAGLMKFPLFEKSVYTLQRTVEELCRVKDCIISVIRTGNIRQVKTFDDWHYNYLVLGISVGCLLLIRASCCILSALAALPGCPSEWLKSRKEARTEATTA